MEHIEVLNIEQQWTLKRKDFHLQHFIALEKMLS